MSRILKTLATLCLLCLVGVSIYLSAECFDVAKRLNTPMVWAMTASSFILALVQVLMLAYLLFCKRLRL